MAALSHDERIAALTLAEVYPHYVTKAEKKGHSERALLEVIGRQGGGDLASVTIFDRYEGQGVPEGQVSLAFRLTFQRTDRTLTDAEVGKRVDRVVRTLSQRFGGTLRREGGKA